MEIRLGDIITTLTDYHANGSYEVLKKHVDLLDEEDYALMVRTTNFEQNDFQRINKYITKDAYDHMRKSKVFPNDIIMNKIANAGSVYLMPDLHRPVSLAMNLFLIRVDEKKANPIYTFNHLKLYEPYIKTFAQGTAAKTITKEAVRNLKFDFPNLKIQTKIASILSVYDELIENNKLRIKLLEEVAEEIYKEWFVRFRFPGYEATKFTNEQGKEVPHGTLGALPEGWSHTTLAEHVKIYRGKSYSSAELREDTGLPMLNLKNINRGGGFRRDGLKYFEGKYSKNNLAYPGDLIMAVTDMTQNRELVGKVARVPDMSLPEFIISMDLIKLVPTKLPSNFVYSFFRYSGIASRLAEFANGVNVLHLTPDLISLEKAKLPTVDLANKYVKMFDPILIEIDILENKNQLLQQTRDLLLPRLISGKLSVEHLIEEESEYLAMAAEPELTYVK